MIYPEAMKPQQAISWISVVLINIWAIVKGWKLFICEQLIYCPIIEGQILIHSFGEFPINIAIGHAAEYYNSQKNLS